MLDGACHGKMECQTGLDRLQAHCKWEILEDATRIPQVRLPPVSNAERTLNTVATYNEMENIPGLAGAFLLRPGSGHLGD